MSGYATGGKLARQTVKSTHIHLGTATAHMRNAQITAQTQANSNAIIIIIIITIKCIRTFSWCGNTHHMLTITQ